MKFSTPIPNVNLILELATPILVGRMLSKNPLDTTRRPLDKEAIAQALRLAIIGELDAINLYLQLAEAIQDEKIRRILKDIAEEEKTHVGELLEALKMVDPEQLEALEKGRKEVEELMRKLRT